MLHIVWKNGWVVIKGASEHWLQNRAGFLVARTAMPAWEAEIQPNAKVCFSFINEWVKVSSLLAGFLLIPCRNEARGVWMSGCVEIYWKRSTQKLFYFFNVLDCPITCCRVWWWSRLYEKTLIYFHIFVKCSTIST